MKRLKINAVLKNIKLILPILITITIIGCKKILDIPPPIGQITSSQVFSTDAQATSAAAGMYYQLINNSPLTFGNGGVSIFCGMSADELLLFNQSTTDYAEFQGNNLTSLNGAIDSRLWSASYYTIYCANAIISGLKTYSGVHDSVKNELTGEAEFVRAYCYFYLVNLFGNIPLVTTINWQQTNLLSRSSSANVYALMTADLTDAINRLPADYSVGHGQRIIPNKWAATALLARVYLYLNDYKDAAAQASIVIGNSLYTLSPLSGPSEIFSANSSEAIWQLQQNNNIYPSFNTTPEGYQLIPADLNSGYPPFAYLTNELLNSFEPGDLRKTNWIDSTSYNGIEYYFPYKYKGGAAQATSGGAYSEYYMMLRLTEQYLIRAEAETNGIGSGLTGAVADLNVIRSRAGLPNYSGPMNTTSVLAEIMHERQVEFFMEWGNRWLDLKRSGQATTVLTKTKGITVSKNALLYPIPVGELETDPNLTQNPGY
jgi:hypothetical protein